MKPDLSAIEAAARAATPGPWPLEKRPNASGWTFLIGTDHMRANDAMVEMFDFHLTPQHLAAGECEANAIHIINCSPETVLAMIKAIKAAQAVADTFEPICSTDAENALRRALEPFADTAGGA